MTKLTINRSGDLARPPRAYFHCLHSDFVEDLFQKVESNSFQEATKPHLEIGPPTIGYAPFQGIPVENEPQDPREGTIYDDPDYKEFVESLKAPVQKLSAEEIAANIAQRKKEAPKTTPLLEQLREKKTAGKEKARASKGGPVTGRQQVKEEKQNNKSKNPQEKADKDSYPAVEQAKKETKANNVPKEGVKVLKKEPTPAAQNIPSVASSSLTGRAPPTQSNTVIPSPRKKRERGNATTAAMMLQRDLGIGTGAQKKRNAKQNTTNDAAGDSQTQTSSANIKSLEPAKSDQNVSSEITSQTTDNDVRSQKKRGENDFQSKKPSSNAQVPKGSGPVKTKGKSGTGNVQSSTSQEAVGVSSQKQQQQQQNKSARLQRQPETHSRQAFLKHANASQGITEPLLQESMSRFGEIESVTIDKRKGFAYVDFVGPEGLAAAMTASPISVAQGAVVVLERRDKPVHAPGTSGQRGGHARGGGKVGGPGRGGRGGRGRGRSGSPAVSAQTNEVQTGKVASAADSRETTTSG